MALMRGANLLKTVALARRAAFATAAALIGLSALGQLSVTAGEPHPIDSSRIVSIGGAVTEIVYALGLESKIVGVDSTSLYPPDALTRAPNVGYMRALSGEGILSLRPSSVIAVDGSGPPQALKQVTDAGVPLAMVSDEPSPDGVVKKIETIGALLREGEKAAALASETRARFELVEKMRPQGPKPPRVLFVLSLQNGRPMVGGRGTAADAVIKLAGGLNAADGIDGFKPMTDEGIIAAAPDVILKMTNGNLVGDKGEIFSLPAFAATPAVADRALIGMDGVYLLGFGPRTPDAVRDLMAALYPDITLPSLPKLADRK
jgi:iron complex transport system substrate-binding protein